MVKLAFNSNELLSRRGGFASFSCFFFYCFLFACSFSIFAVGEIVLVSFHTIQFCFSHWRRFDCVIKKNQLIWLKKVTVYCRRAATNLISVINLEIALTHFNSTFCKQFFLRFARFRLYSSVRPQTKTKRKGQATEQTLTLHLHELILRRFLYDLFYFKIVSLVM